MAGDTAIIPRRSAGDGEREGEGTLARQCRIYCRCWRGEGAGGEMVARGVLDEMSRFYD